MPINRRDLLGFATVGVAVSTPLGRVADRHSFKAVAFDGFTTFDPRPIAVLAERLYPGNGAALTSAWRTRQFEYTWLRTLMNRYADFWQVTEEALVFAASTVKLELTTEKRGELMQAWLEIKAWPDALPALRALKEDGVRLAFLSNLTAAMIDAAVRNSGLEGLFEPNLSTDRVRAFKPDPRAYQMGIDAFRLRREEILFAAFGGWDAAGARAFGYPTFWVNRGKTPVEELGVAADATGADLHDLAGFVLSGR